MLMRRTRPPAAGYAPDAAVAAAGDELAHLDGIADQRLRDPGRFGECAVGRAQGPAPPKTCRSMSRHVEQLMYEDDAGWTPSANRMRSTSGGKSGSLSTSSRSSMKCVNASAAIRASFSARVLSK